MKNVLGAFSLSFAVFLSYIELGSQAGGRAVEYGIQQPDVHPFTDHREIGYYLDLAGGRHQIGPGRRLVVTKDNLVAAVEVNSHFFQPVHRDGYTKGYDLGDNFYGKPYSQVHDYPNIEWVTTRRDKNGNPVHAA